MAFLMPRYARTFVCILAIEIAPAMAADVDPLAGVHTVAIESTLGDGLILKQNTDLFGASAPDIALHSGADLDAFVAEQIRAALGSRFTIVDSPASSDTLIVVHAAQIDQHLYIPPIAATFHYSGLSATLTKGLLAGHSILLSAQYAVSVIDAKTGKEIAYGKAKGPATGMFGAEPDPIETCGDAFWPADPSHPSDDEIAQIRADLMAIIAMSLPNALKFAGLAPQGNDTKLTQWRGRTLICKEFG